MENLKGNIFYSFQFFTKLNTFGGILAKPVFPFYIPDKNTSKSQFSSDASKIDDTVLLIVDGLVVTLCVKLPFSYQVPMN